MQQVLFICIGNSCRSQMAEGFARTYGSDILIARSAGLAPAPIIAPLTFQVMSEKNIDLREQFPKDLGILSSERFDLLVNMSGRPLPAKLRIPVIEWTVVDPIGQKESVYREVCNQIESLVMKLIMEIRARHSKPPKPSDSGPKSALTLREQRILARRRQSG